MSNQSTIGLEVKGLQCRIGDRYVLRDLQFAMHSRTRLALIGRNGSGKTSLLRCLLGRLKYEGTVLLDGRPLTELTSGERAAKIAYVPQRLDLAFNFAVEEFLSLGQFALQARYHSGKRRRMREEALEQVGATHLRPRLINQLSMGERQRVLLAAALAQGADLLLLDEPTAYLDPPGVEQFFSVLGSLPPDTRFILASHELNVAMSLCTQVLALEQGTSCFQGSPQQCLQEEVLHRVFGITPELLQVPGRALRVLLPPRADEGRLP